MILNGAGLHPDHTIVAAVHLSGVGALTVLKIGEASGRGREEDTRQFAIRASLPPPFRERGLAREIYGIFTMM